MSDLEEWVATFARKGCPSCGKPVAQGRRHGARATCGDPICIQRCRGNQGRCPICGRVRGLGVRGERLLTCGAAECARRAKGKNTERPMPKGMEQHTDPRSCRCGAKLVFLVDMYGQCTEACDRCGYRKHFGQHPIKDAA